MTFANKEELNLHAIMNVMKIVTEFERSVAVHGASLSTDEFFERCNQAVGSGTMDLQPKSILYNLKLLDDHP